MQRSKLEPIKYNYRVDGDIQDIAVEWTGTGWAVRRNSMCMGKAGKWIFEPMPSSRDEEFFRENRFETPEAAVQAIEEFEIRYLCNCGAGFRYPQQRTIHGSTCPSMQKEK